jgi:hypothetical protein
VWVWGGVWAGYPDPSRPESSTVSDMSGHWEHELFKGFRMHKVSLPNSKPPSRCMAKRAVWGRGWNSHSPQGGNWGRGSGRGSGWV